MIHPHRPPKHTELKENNVLHVVSVVSNPVRYASRYRLHEQFAEHVKQDPQVHHVTVELAFGDRQHEVTQAGNPDHVQLRVSHELWHKENMINIGVRHLPHDWKYLAWIDADVEFLNKGWAQETLHQLQHYSIVQMFENAVDLGPRNNVIQAHTSFGKQYVTGAPAKWTAGPYGKATDAPYWHPGYAWACSRYYYENVGGLIDKAIVGAGDHHMALSIIGQAKVSLPTGLHPNYEKMVYEWQERAQRAAQRNLGYVEGSILHHWHGPKKSRGYWSRWAIAKEHQYDPERDINYNSQGVLELVGNKPGMRDALRDYFRSRNEDSRDD